MAENVIERMNRIDAKRKIADFMVKEKQEVEYKIICADDFFEHLHTKRLVTDDKILYPMSTFERMIRYIKYGYMPCRETKIKIATAINKISREEIIANKSLYDGLD